MTDTRYCPFHQLNVTNKLTQAGLSDYLWTIIEGYLQNDHATVSSNFRNLVAKIFGNKLPTNSSTTFLK